MNLTETARENLAAALPLIAATAAKASSLKSDHIRGMRTILTAAQDDTCAGCGESLTGKVVELCHIVPSTHERTGYGIAPGAVYAGCKPCNAYEQGKTAAEIVASMARPDVVTLTLPDRQACLSAAGSSVADVARIRDAILAG